MPSKKKKKRVVDAVDEEDDDTTAVETLRVFVYCPSGRVRRTYAGEAILPSNNNGGNAGAGGIDQRHTNAETEFSEDEEEDEDLGGCARCHDDDDDDDDDDEEEEDDDGGDDEWCTNNNNNKKNNKKGKGTKKKKATGGTAAGHGGNGREEAPKKKKRGVVTIREQVERIKQAFKRGVVNEDGVADVAVWRENGYNTYIVHNARLWFVNNWTDSDGRPLPEPDGIEDFLRSQTISTKKFGDLILGEVADRVDRIAEYSYCETGDRQAVIPHPTTSIVGPLLKKSGSDDYTICEAVHYLIKKSRKQKRRVGKQKTQDVSEKVKAMLDYLIERHLCWAGMDGSDKNGAGNVRYQEKHQDAGGYAAVMLLMNNIAIPKNLEVPVGLTHLYAENETALKVALLVVNSRRYKIHREAANLQKEKVFQPIWVGPRGDNWKKHEDVGRGRDDFDRFLREEIFLGNVCRECKRESITKDDAVEEEEQEYNDEDITEDDAVEEEEQECMDEFITEDGAVEEEQQEDNDEDITEDETMEEEQQEYQKQDFRWSFLNQTIDHYEEAKLVKLMHTMMRNGKKVAKQPCECTFQELQDQKEACEEICNRDGVASLDVTCTDHHRLRDQSSATQVLCGKVQKEDTTYGDVRLNRLAIRRKAIVLIALYESGVDLEELDVDTIDWPNMTIRCAYSGLPIPYDEMEIADSHHVLELCQLELEYNGACYKIEGMAKTDRVSDIKNGDSQRGYVDRLSDQLSITVAIRASVHRLTHKGMHMIENEQVTGVESPLVFNRAEKKVIIDASTYTQFQQYLPANALVARDDDNEAEDEVADSEVVGSDDIDEDLTKDVVEASLSSDANMNEDDVDMGGVMADVPHRSETTSLQLAADNSKVTELEAAVAALQDRIAAMKSTHERESAKMTETIAKLETEKEAAIAANASLEWDITTLTNKMEDLKFEVEEKSSTIDSLTTAKSALVEEMTGLRDDCADHVAALEAARAFAISAKDEEMASMVIERNQTIESMQVEHNTHVARLEATHRGKMEEMDREHNQIIESMKAAKNDEMAALETAHAAAIATKDEVMAAAISTKNDEMAALEAAHAAAIATKDEVMAAAISTKNDEMAALEAAHAAAIATKNEEVSDLREEMADMRIDLEIASNDLENASNFYHYYRQKTNNMKRQIDDLMEEAENNANVLEENDECIIDYEEEVKYLQDRVESLDAELQDTKAALSEYESSTVVQVVSGIVFNSRKRRRVSVNNDDN